MIRRSFVAVLSLAFALPLSAVPITYTATLYDAVPVIGTISQPNGQASNPVGAVYYSFFANVGASVTVTGARLSGPYDMAFWVFSGLFTDTAQFGASFSTGHPNYIAFGDDQLPPNIPGPYGDPQVIFNAPSTGFYTVAVTNFLSNGTPPYEFRLTATGVSSSEIPEPGTWGLIGLGIAAVALMRRR